MTVYFEGKPLVDANDFGARLKHLREAAGLSQPALAAKAGVSVRQISRLETGASVATWPNILALAGALGVSCEAFTVAPAAPPVTPRRGRPRKPPAVAQDAPTVAPEADAPTTPPKRPQGRRRG